MPTKTGLPWLILSQLIVTLGLLGFAFAQGDGAIQNLVVGAVIAHWLSESTHLGRQVADQRVANIIGGGGAGTTVVSSAVPAPPPVIPPDDPLATE